MNRCETCCHQAVCYVPVLEGKLGGAIRFQRCDNYMNKKNTIHVDEDMALALVAGAAASENMARRVSLFEMGGNDQRTISFSEAAHALRRAGEKMLRPRGVCDG